MDQPAAAAVVVAAVARVRVPDVNVVVVDVLIGDLISVAFYLHHYCYPPIWCVGSTFACAMVAAVMMEEAVMIVPVGRNFPPAHLVVVL